jgi:hypothetical protein
MIKGEAAMWSSMKAMRTGWEANRHHRSDPQLDNYCKIEPEEHQLNNILNQERQEQDNQRRTGLEANRQHPYKTIRSAARCKNRIRRAATTTTSTKKDKSKQIIEGEPRQQMGGANRSGTGGKYKEQQGATPAAAGCGYVKRHMRTGYKGSKLPFVEEAAGFKSTIGSLAALAALSLNLIIEKYIPQDYRRRQIT